MTQKVPEPLVTISQKSVTNELHGSEIVDRTLIKRFWQAFFISRQTSKKEVDRRLEYLFWRIWSSEDLLDHTNIHYLDSLVSRIMASEPLNSDKDGLKFPSPSSGAMRTYTSPRAVPQAEAESPGQSKSAPHTEIPGSLHPILKKPNTAPGEVHKTTRLLLERPDGERVTLNPSYPPTPIEVTHPKDVTTPQKAPKKATHLTTNRAIRGARRRPVFTRRKSSQTSVSKTSVSPRGRQPETKHDDSAEPLFSVDDDLHTEQNFPKGSDPKISRDATWTDVGHVSFDLSSPTIAPATTSTIIPDEISMPKPELAPAVLEITDKQDPILPQGIETVSVEIHTQEPASKPNAEPLDHSLYDKPAIFNTNNISPATQTPLLGFPESDRIQMPEQLMRSLIHIITDARPDEKYPPAPTHSFDLADRPCQPSPNYSFEYMLQGAEASSSNPQPGRSRLVMKGFRKHWTEVIEEANQITRDDEVAGIQTLRETSACAPVPADVDEDPPTVEEVNEECPYEIPDSNLVPLASQLSRHVIQ
ncbi:uncharacterized protein N7483_000691 [Penicillium malachiteum]|uniref:uncharacterized protein n=1 Tax=Penicillium malachiteum TaxID=1324776 RepID=UPI00254989C2|nr:uncharacterized protein N7483_000691 [Penicillium malachiteum]KAJ5735566.1 hypothetical protein N7483_000691 [Penicillium malachiteum]